FRFSLAALHQDVALTIRTLEPDLQATVRTRSELCDVLLAHDRARACGASGENSSSVFDLLAEVIEKSGGRIAEHPVEMVAQIISRHWREIEVREKFCEIRIRQLVGVAVQVVGFVAFAFDSSSNHHPEHVIPNFTAIAVDVFQLNWREHTIVEAHTELWIRKYPRLISECIRARLNE